MYIINVVTIIIKYYDTNNVQIRKDQLSMYNNRI